MVTRAKRMEKVVVASCWLLEDLPWSELIRDIGPNVTEDYELTTSH